jgi:hypothetical protein
LRDYVKPGALYLANGVWDSEWLLPQIWAGYAMTAIHAGTSHAVRFRTNTDFPPRHRLGIWCFRPVDLHLVPPPVIVGINHGTDFPMDLLALSHVIAMAIVAWHSRWHIKHRQLRVT